MSNEDLHLIPEPIYEDEDSESLSLTVAEIIFMLKQLPYGAEVWVKGESPKTYLAIENVELGPKGTVTIKGTWHFRIEVPNA